MSEFNPSLVSLFSTLARTTRSPQYKFYRTIYPVLRHVIVPSPFTRTLADYDAAIQIFPERFNLQNVGNIFALWASIEQAKLLCAGKHIPKIQAEYLYDSLTYLSTISTELYTHQGNAQDFVLHVQLSNDGFLYKRPEELYLLKSNVKRRRDNRWHLLALTEFKDALAPIRTFSSAYCNSNNFFVFYNFDLECIRIICRERNIAISVTFEPGYPENDFKDSWQEWT